MIPFLYLFFNSKKRYNGGISQDKGESAMANIFSELQIKGKTLKNRIVMAPAERVGYTYHDGVMGKDVVREYEILADNNIGLMMSQSLVVSAQDVAAVGFPVPGAYRPEQIEPLKRIVKAAHKNGSVFIAQLGAAFAYSPRFTTADMERIRDNYLHCARLCLEAEVDGIEIHGAHNVSLNHIISPVTNKRTDKYRDGMNFVREIVDGIRGFADGNLILSFRMGCCFDWEKDIQTAKVAESIGFDILNVSVGVQEGYAPGIPANYEYTPMTYAASLLKGYVSIPVIAAWGIETLRRGDKLIRNGDADLAAYAKSFLADPAFVTKSMNNMDYKPCFGCRNCKWYTNGHQCPGRARAAK